MPKSISEGLSTVTSVAENIKSDYGAFHVVQYDSTGTVVTPLASGGSVNTELPAAAAITDANANPTTPIVGSSLLLWNGSTWDRQRNNNEGTALASAARTATVSSADQTNYNARGAYIFISATAASATPSIVFTVEVKDPISGFYSAILTSAAITGISSTVLCVYPGATAAANLTVSMPLPRTWRVTATHGDADSITYSVGYTLIA